ncbi:hypothetical protein [Clostridium perfringens]|uniref:hypothetical protein n=1 Tax=Clostridium perfringens TaxID=1502 RepID=UPI001A265F96|nr:hypothetical protein [Clostridium perfringens]
MKEELIKLKLPKEYKEGLFEYQIGLDNVPDWPTLQKLGWTFKEHLKLEALVGIEHMKYSLKEAINDNEITEEEIKECNKIIEANIDKYNKM